MDAQQPAGGGPPLGSDRPATVAEERLQLAAQAARIGVWDWDLETGEMVYSAIAREICGLAPHTPIDFDLTERLVHPQDRPRTLPLLQRALDPAVRDETPYEYRIVRPDGEVRWVLAHGKAVFEPREGVLRAVRYAGALQDITDRRRLEEANRAFTERLRFAMRAGRLGSFEYDIAAGVLRIDEALLELIGRPADAGQTPPAGALAWVHPHDRSLARRLTARVLLRGEPANCGLRVLTAQGQTRWCEASATLIRDETGRATHVFGYAVDVTARRTAEQALAERQALLVSLLDTAAVYMGVVEVSADGFVLTTLNKAAARLFDVTADSLPIDARTAGVDEDRIVVAREALMRVWTSGQAETFEHAFQMRGRSAWVLGSYSPLPAGPGEAPRLAFVITDISDRKAAEERQRLLMREVDHRAKNALAVAQAVVELTREADPAAFKQAVVGRVAAIARTHSLLADGRWEGVDFGRLVREELAPYATEAPGRLDVEGPACSLEPQAAQMLGMVVHELATNAVKYGALRDREGALAVRWSLDGRGAMEFRWTETCGRPVSAEPPKTQGFGLRLLDQTIARQMGGRWRADWTSRGLSFSMSLPLMAPAEAPAPAPAPPPPSPGRRRAVILEDEPLIALELESCLEDLGFEVTATAISAAEAQALVDAPAELAVCDVDLRGETTFAVAEAMAAAGKLVIFSTGYAALQPPPALASAPVLVKPVTRQALAAALAAAGRG